MVERRQEALVDLEQSPLGVGAARELARLVDELLVARGVGHRLRRVAGEDRDRLEVVIGEPVESELAEDDDAERAALVEHRHDEHRLRNVLGAVNRLAALVVECVVDQQRLAVLGHPSGEALSDRHTESLDRVLGIALEHLAGEGDRLADIAFPVHAVDPDVVEIRQWRRLGHDRLRDGGHVGQAIETRGQVLDRAHARRLRRHGPIQPRVLDGDRGLVGKRLDQRDLLLGPVALGTVVEAEQAEWLVAADQRHEADGPDPLLLVAGMQQADRVLVVEAHGIGSSFAQRPDPDRVGVHLEPFDAFEEGIAQTVVGRHAEGLSIRRRHQPEPGLVGLEQRAGEVDDLPEHRGQVERPGELLRDRSEGSRALELTPGPAEEPGARQRCRHHRRQRASELRRLPAGGLVVEDEQADRSALRGEHDRRVRIVGSQRARDRWRVVEPGVRGQLEGLALADVDGRAVDVELRAQRLDDRAGNRGCRRR